MTEGSIKIAQGCDFNMILYVYDNDGSRKDLTGYSANFRVSNKAVTHKYIDITGEVNNLRTSSYKGSCVPDAYAYGVIKIAIKPHSCKELPTNNEAEEASKLQTNNIYSVSIINDTTNEITKVAQYDCYTEVEL